MVADSRPPPITNTNPNRYDIATPRQILGADRREGRRKSATRDDDPHPPSTARGSGGGSADRGRSALVAAHERRRHASAFLTHGRPAARRAVPRGPAAR